MKYPAYDTYRPSPFSWMDRVPQHWDASALRWLSNRYAGGTPDKGNDAYWEDGTIPWLNSGAVNDGYITAPSELITPEGFANSSAKWIPKGALVMALAGQGKTKGMVAQLGIATTCNQSMAAIIPARRLDSRYLYWWLTANYQNIRNLAGGEARDGLNLDLLGSIPCPLPPLSEQQAIARFLNARSVQIDGLMAQTRLLIAKLKEKRLALIARTVTHGLPPEAAKAAGLQPTLGLRKSGIDWAPKIPTDWDAIAIKYVAEIASGHTPSRAIEEYWVDCTIPWISLNDSSYLREHDSIAETYYQISELGMANSSAHLLPERTVVLSRDATVGLCAITTRPMAVSQHFVAYICGSRLLPEYLLLTLKAMRQHLERLSVGSTIATIGMADIRSLEIPLPSVLAQRAIVDYVSRATEQLDGLVHKVEAALVRLTEYRQALIASAVTGKFDVREPA